MPIQFCCLSFCLFFVYQSMPGLQREGLTAGNWRGFVSLTLLATLRMLGLAKVRRPGLRRVTGGVRLGGGKRGLVSPSPGVSSRDGDCSEVLLFFSGDSSSEVLFLLDGESCEGLGLLDGELGDGDVSAFSFKASCGLLRDSELCPDIIKGSFPLILTWFLTRVLFKRFLKGLLAASIFLRFCISSGRLSGALV